MGINNLLTKLNYKILYYILTLFHKKTKKIVILIPFNIIDLIKTKTKNYTSYCKDII